jgi:hypothetical protein
MEAETTGCSMGIPHSIQDTHWNVTLTDRLQENLPFPHRARAQSALGHPEMEHGFKTSRRIQEAPDLGTGGMKK